MWPTRKWAVEIRGMGQRLVLTKKHPLSVFAKVQGLILIYKLSDTGFFSQGHSHINQAYRDWTINRDAIFRIIIVTRACMIRAFLSSRQEREGKITIICLLLESGVRLRKISWIKMAKILKKHCVSGILLNISCVWLHLVSLNVPLQ